jgi:hypothetical protein
MAAVPRWCVAALCPAGFDGGDPACHPPGRGCAQCPQFAGQVVPGEDHRVPPGLHQVQVRCRGQVPGAAAVFDGGRAEPERDDLLGHLDGAGAAQRQVRDRYRRGSAGCLVSRGHCGEGGEHGRGTPVQLLACPVGVTGPGQVREYADHPWDLPAAWMLRPRYLA